MEPEGGGTQPSVRIIALSLSRHLTRCITGLGTYLTSLFQIEIVNVKFAHVIQRLSLGKVYII